MKRKDKIHVLFCFHYSGLNNGAVRSLVDVIETLIKKNRIIAFVIYPDKKGSAINYLEQLGVKCIHIPFYRVDYHKQANINESFKEKTKFILRKIISPLCIRRAISFVKKYRVEIIYSNTVVIDYGIKLSIKTCIPHIWHIREFGAEDHNLSFVGGETKLYSNLSQSNAVIFISNSISNKYCNYMKKAQQYVIYNDISKAFINPKIQFNLDTTKPVNVAIIGTIQPGKNQFDAVKAVQLVNKNYIKAILHIAGDMSGEYYKKIKEYVERNNIYNYILFDGFILDMNAYRKSMDVGIVASSNEAFGRVTIEGMLSSMAIIGVNTAGTAELICNKQNGLLYKKNDVEELAQKLELFCDDRQYMKKIAENGFHNAVERFTKNQAADQILKVMEDTI